MSRSSATPDGPQWTSAMGDPLAPLYVRNRRDGSRLLSSAVVVFCIATTQLHHAFGWWLALTSGVVCMYWGLAYRRLRVER